MDSYGGAQLAPPSRGGTPPLVCVLDQSLGGQVHFHPRSRIARRYGGDARSATERPAPVCKDRDGHADLALPVSSSTADHTAVPQGRRDQASRNLPHLPLCWTWPLQPARAVTQLLAARGLADVVAYGGRLPGSAAVGLELEPEPRSRDITVAAIPRVLVRMFDGGEPGRPAGGRGHDGPCRLSRNT